MTDEAPRLCRHHEHDGFDERFDVTYIEGRMIVSDGLREVAVVATPPDPMAPPRHPRRQGGYRLDLDDRDMASAFTMDWYETPDAALNCACDYLVKRRGSDLDPSTRLEEFVRQLPRVSVDLQKPNR